MNKKSNLLVATRLSEDRKLPEEQVSLHIFRSHVFQLKEDVNRLGFMLAEIQDVLSSSSAERRIGF